MIPEKFVDLYALGSNLQDTLVAERDVVLTYVLKILSDHRVLEQLAFKGGTCIRKHFLGSTARFSEDLDSGPPICNTIYLQKRALKQLGGGEFPNRIRVVVTVEK